ncbi:MAG: hypothetical protein QNI84_01025 [Henriciella sp.]|nr:hypothetical protein [Henriciella sp.]
MISVPGHDDARQPTVDVLSNGRTHRGAVVKEANAKWPLWWTVLGVTFVCSFVWSLIFSLIF